MSFYKKHVRPELFRHDPEEIHDRALRFLRRVGNTPLLRGAIKAMLAVHNKRLGQTLFGLTFPNPVGLAAGMDKGGVALRGFEALGFGSVEMGGITAIEQEGNPKPRIFRLPEDVALINRMGFNNPGAEKVAYRLRSARLPSVPLGVNIGKSAVVPVNDMDAVANDYCYTFGKLYPYADFIVLNVSSPNTLGLRALQRQEFLRILLAGIQRQNLKMPRKPGERVKPVLLKIAPDLEWKEIDQILAVMQGAKIDGIVAANTTVNRDGLQTKSAVAQEKGGLSGRLLLGRTIELVGYIRKKALSLPIIGVGGIFSGEDALEVIKAGASLVQIYTGLVYEGPLLPRRINAKLVQLMKRDGVKSISEWSPHVNRS